MHIPGRRHVRRALRWAASRLSEGVVILGYHRLGNSADDPFGLCVSREHFTAQLAVLKQRASVLTLREALDALRRGGRLPPRAVVVTFDDGYDDTVEGVMPLLEQHGVPATVFVTAGSPGRVFWWDELRELLSQRRSPATLELEIGGTRRAWPVGGADRTSTRSRRRMLSAISVELSVLSAADRDGQMSRIRAWCRSGDAGESPDPGAALPRGLTTDEVRRLGQSQFVEVGAHTMSHSALSSLPMSAQVREIQESRSTLEGLVAKTVSLFSYPHGSYAPSTMEVVRRCGFVAACCSTPDVANARSDAFALPRLWVPDIGGPSFDRWLRRWLVN